MHKLLTRIVFGCIFLVPSAIKAQQEARLLRFPAVHGNQVVFTYAGDLYTVARSGGTARKLTNHPGYEMFPHFSHDGKQVAFTAQYDGNTEVYVMPAEGGEPKRITYTATIGRDDIADRMGPNNIVMGWTPDDKQVLYRGRSNSFNPFKGQLFLAPLSGDLPAELPFSVAGWATYNGDGSKLAMNHVFREFRTWKYYKGGMADDVWLFDVKSHQAEDISNNPSQDVFPMYYGDKVYYMSDRDGRMNLFEYDVPGKTTRKVTDFKEYDCKFPSLGDHAIAFENGGYIYLYDLLAGKVEKVSITLAEDFASGRNVQIDAAKFMNGYAVSPDGKRAVFEARGEVFSVPAKAGVTRNLTQSSGAHDRNVSWSPDGKWISYLSDKTGEDELYIQVQDGASEAKQLTKGGGSYKFNPVWSPDSKYLLLADRSQDLYTIQVATGARTLIAHSDSQEISDYSVGPDSKWIAYTKPGTAREFTTIQLYNTVTKETIPVTDDWYNSDQPAFSTDGKFLYFVSSRDFNPTYSQTEWNHVYTNMEKPYFVRLAADTESPFKNENDEVAVKADADSTAKEGNSKPVANTGGMKVDKDGLADRIESLPVVPGSYYGLVGGLNGLYYSSRSANLPSSLRYYDLKEQKEKEIGAFRGYSVSNDLKKILLQNGGNFYIEDLGTSKLEPTHQLDLKGLSIVTNLHEEWKQIYDESWRQMRDYFYDPNMHGVDWKAMHDKYAQLLPYVNHRNDLTYLIGELIGELNIGHAYVNGGDRPDVQRIPMGMLGARFSRDKGGYYRIDSILSGQGWNKELISPLRAPGVDIKKGNYITAIDGKDVRQFANIYQGLIAKAGQTVELSVSNSANGESSRKVYVKPVADESGLYYHEWVQQNIAKVTKASGGKIGYVHIPDMGPDGLNQFARYFYPQLDKQALIIDDRGNGGGNVSPMIIERLLRRPALGVMTRNAKTASIKPDAQVGPKVCLIDQYSASDGDLFPYQFQYYKIGPLIGQRTWGGVVGIRGSLPFIDDGEMTKPEFAHFAADGSGFVIEGHGVDPDIQVIQDPYEEYQGHDQQLQKAVDELLKELAAKPSEGMPKIPPFPVKAPKP